MSSCRALAAYRLSDASAYQSKPTAKILRPVQAALLVAQEMGALLGGSALLLEAMPQ